MALLGGLDGRDDFHGKGANTPARIAPVNGLLESIESILNKNELPHNHRSVWKGFFAQNRQTFLPSVPI